MNWCRIIGHDWVYDFMHEIVEYPHSHRPKNIVKLNVRLCKRCSKKQKTKLGSGTYNFKLGKYCNWKEIELTKSEERQKKIKKLGL
jgi:hypothetical protein